VIDCVDNALTFNKKAPLNLPAIQIFGWYS
jgi:hypothetical protein